MKKKTKIILWCLSIFFLLGALGCLSKTLLAALFLFLASISCNPLFLNYLVKIGKNPPKIVKIAITFVLFMIGGSMIPSIQDTTIPIKATTDKITANIVEKQVKNISETTTITIPSSEEITTEQIVSNVESSLSDIDQEEQILVESVVSETTIEEITTVEEIIEETTTQETVPTTTEIQTTQEEIPTEIIVHITRTGSKYHRSGCQYLRKSDISISLDDAKSRGYSPCSKCNPPR